MVFAKPQLENSFSRGRGKQTKLTTVKNKIIHLSFIYKIYKEGGIFLIQHSLITVTTECKIGKTNYIVHSLTSEKATEDICKKIKKLIKKDIEQMSENIIF